MICLWKQLGNVSVAWNYTQRPGGLIRCRLRRGALFFASPGRWQGTSGHGEAARRYQVQIDGSEVTCHDEIVSVTSKKQDTSASARQPKDAVPGDETVRVPRYLINVTKVIGIDFGAGYKTVMGWRRHLIKPSEL